MKKTIVALLLFSVFLVLSYSASAQKNKGKIQAEKDIHTDSLTTYILQELNQFRKKNKLDTFELYDKLSDAAYLSAEDLSDDKSSKADPKELPKYLKSVGLTKNAEQLAGNIPMPKYTYFGFNRISFSF